MTKNDSLKKLVRNSCLSEWEGCLCWQPKGHDGLHECGAPQCECTWTDEQARQWWEELKASFAAHTEL